jgi:DNA-directed RNA polymerase specialized sigma24 family protein
MKNELPDQPSPQQQKAFSLQQSGLSYGQIAKVMDVTLDSVHTYIKRARRRNRILAAAKLAAQ